MIVTFSHLNTIRPLNIPTEVSTSNVRWIPFMREGEHQDVIPKIGVDIYYLIDNNKAKYNDVIQGCYYNDNQSYHRGLGIAIAYFVYARWVRDMVIQSTNFGMVVKTTEFSLPASPQQIRLAEEASREEGDQCLQSTISYMESIDLFQNKKVPHSLSYLDVLAIGD